MSRPALPLRLRSGDVVTAIDPSPLVLPPGSPGRAALCLACQQCIGPRPALVVILVPTGAVPCDCGRIRIAAYWAHQDCQLEDAGAVLELAGARARACLAGDQP